MKILNLEIMDYNETRKDNKIQPSEISVLVEFVTTVDNKKPGFFTLDFQTTTTNDAGAYSQELKVYRDSESFKEFQRYFGDSTDSIIDIVEREANPKKFWLNYVDSTYKLNDSDFGGLDANSKTNEAVRL